MMLDKIFNTYNPLKKGRFRVLREKEEIKDLDIIPVLLLKINTL